MIKIKSMTILLTVVVSLLSGALAESSAEKPAQVMVFGVFHFSNPGLDVVKSEQIDVMSEHNQTYLSELVNRIAKFKPTHILIECDLELTARYQTDYAAYLKDQFTLSPNENHQLGFRIAEVAGLTEPTAIECYNESEIGWNNKLLLEYMPEHDKASDEAYRALIATVTQKISHAHQTKSFAELLMQSNSPEWDRLNKSLYLLTNSVGAGQNFAGADAAASWWHRNFRMYANIQKVAKPATRVVVIGGQGHTAIFREMLANDMHRQAVDVRPYIM
ncbi:DUF5694 domain-containing protein [Alteromonas sp. ASW11-130]|uniref:DUF5694 domain-containing protein n=1 Tax=Alteromonas sp. ASW11-130 TaxID=3015775 RepID=UPI0022426164|nr:DUF5694 domain-containing protein [Alteromonas sp. ASW11-130]MCW8091996.1 DUF5694 domain-containing protein [Alteromonas sp. ASW11-130]